MVDGVPRGAFQNDDPARDHVGGPAALLGSLDLARALVRPAEMCRAYRRHLRYLMQNGMGQARQDIGVPSGIAIEADRPDETARPRTCRCLNVAERTGGIPEMLNRACGPLRRV